MLLIAVLFIVLSCSTAASSNSNGQVNTTGGRRVHRVRVDASASAFRPNSLEVDVGDWVVFELPRLDYTLSKSTLKHPCASVYQFDSIINSGNLTNYTGAIVALYITARKSNWFFCQQLDPLSHCDAGKVFALNPGDRMKQFLQNAEEHQTSNITIVPGTGLLAPTAPTSGLSTGTAQSRTAAHATHATNMALATGGAWNQTGWNFTHGTGAPFLSGYATGTVIGTGTGAMTGTETEIETEIETGVGSYFSTGTIFHFPSSPSTILPSPPASNAVLTKSSWMTITILGLIQYLVYQIA